MILGVSRDSRLRIWMRRRLQRLAKTGLITSNAEYMVAGAHRDKPGQVEVHEKTIDILFVVEGEALYVTGGK